MLIVLLAHALDRSGSTKTHPSGIQWGDVPAWVEALSTLLLVIAAVIAGIQAKRAFDEQRAEIGVMREQVNEAKRAFDKRSEEVDVMRAQLVQQKLQFQREQRYQPLVALLILTSHVRHELKSYGIGEWPTDELIPVSDFNLRRAELRVLGVEECERRLVALWFAIRGFEERRKQRDIFGREAKVLPLRLPAGPGPPRRTAEEQNALVNYDVTDQQARARLSHVLTLCDELDAAIKKELAF